MLTVPVILAWMLAGVSGIEAQAVHAPGIEALLRTEIEKRRIPGLQVAVVRGGKIVLLGAYGLANVEHSVPVTARTVFSIHSATKSFTGVAAMQLVESGKLRLDAPLADYLDGLPAAWRPVTIRRLLTHLSGIPNIVDQNTGKMIVDGNQDASWAKVQTMPMEFAPGARFSYNQTNYLLVGRIIEKLSGKSVTAFIGERQFNIAGMEQTTFGDSRDVIPHKAQSYSYLRSQELNAVFAEVPDTLRAANGIHTTAQDLARWIIALQRGDLIREQSNLNVMWAPGVLNGGSSTAYALGWLSASRPAHRVVAGMGGARATFTIYPDDDLAVVILTNLQGAFPEAFTGAVAGHYVPSLLRSAGQ